MGAEGLDWVVERNMKIYVAALGDHLFYDLFSHSPLAPGSASDVYRLSRRSMMIYDVSSIEVGNTVLWTEHYIPANSFY